MVLSAVVVLAAMSLLAPEPAAAHGLVGRMTPQLPLAVYLTGAGIAVALSFAIAFAVDARWRPGPAVMARRVPRGLVVALRVAGLVAWVWIVAQLVVGGSSSAEVGTLFTWVYGWVGIAIVSALLCPVWEWLDPFATLYDIGAWVWRRTGLQGWRHAAYPARLARWPAVAGMVVIVWLELVMRGADMGLIVVGYTILTLTAMAQFGRDQWRAKGEVFSVWFRTLNRLARYASAGDGRLRRQRFPDGLLDRRWDTSEVVLVAVASGAILYDGLSQTLPFFDLFGIPSLGEATLLLAAVLGGISAASLVAARWVGTTRMGAGLLPVSVGYLVAHYLTYLVIDGQRIAIAVSDPLQQGWDLFGTAFFEPSGAWIPPSLAWMTMFAAVVGGHMVGAWAGHLRVGPGRHTRTGLSQLPLALVMTGLTALTLWSLGQAVFQPEPPAETRTLGQASSTITMPVR
jgi:hypothetical protein